jgi:hypothetical protein
VIYYRIKKTGERVYVAQSKQRPSSPYPTRETVYRVKDGHALSGYTMDHIVLEKDWINPKKK